MKKHALLNFRKWVGYVTGQKIKLNESTHGDSQTEILDIFPLKLMATMYHIKILESTGYDLRYKTVLQR